MKSLNGTKNPINLMQFDAATRGYLASERFRSD